MNVHENAKLTSRGRDRIVLLFCGDKRLRRVRRPPAITCKDGFIPDSLPSIASKIELPQYASSQNTTLTELVFPTKSWLTR